MLAKMKEKVEAIRLRKEEGQSVRTIARNLCVSPASVSLWVKDIILTIEQKERLGTGGIIGGQKIASVANQRKTRECRRGWQKQGVDKYRQEDKSYAFGCALFWAEGRKNKNVVRFSNTDERMVVFFTNFLRKYFKVQDDEFVISINCYLNNNLTLEEIQGYWLKKLMLPSSVLRKATIKSKYYEGKESSKHPYGVCEVGVYNTVIAQHIFGSIKDAIGDRSDDWID